MKNTLLYGAAIALITMISACSSSTSHKAHGYDGTFTTKYGMQVELRPDSTTLLTFEKDNTYEGKWTIRVLEGMEYAAIEFAGDSEYYLLHDGVLYIKPENMLSGKLGTRVDYK